MTMWGLKLLLAILILYDVQAFINPYPKLRHYPLKYWDDAGEPLFLTPLIEAGRIDDARKAATVQYEEMHDILSYSGYLTVNKEYDSNTFFWFFPAQLNPRTAPVLLWLQGGPGATSLFGLFMENGPFRVTPQKTLEMRRFSWTKTHSVLYIDNPVGTGYSFTKNDKGYATNETHVGRDVHTALVQFFKLFPELQNNDFFVTGESYGGKYVPAVSHAIKDFNIKADTKINLKGLAIGNGLTDPENQLVYGDYLYQLGLIDTKGRAQFQELEAKGRQLIQAKKFEEAFDVFDELLNGDLHSSSLFKNLTGFDFYFNYMFTKDNQDSDSMSEWVQRPDVRRALHVGNNSFHTEDKTVENHLKGDVMQSLAILIADLTQHYRVLLYNGQLDIIVAYPTTENYLKNLNWTGAEAYKSAVREQWWVGNDLAGYSKTVGSLTEVLVRNAGHMVPSDQPQWALDLITRFTKNKPFGKSNISKFG